MKKSGLIFLISVSLLISGCLETQKEKIRLYVCPDGSLASNADDCEINIEECPETKVMEVIKYVCPDDEIVDDVAECATEPVTTTTLRGLTNPGFSEDKAATNSLAEGAKNSTRSDTTITIREKVATTTSSTSTTTISASSGIKISAVQFDAPGNERENLNGEWVEVSNSGANTDMSGWTLQDEQKHTYNFPSGFEMKTGTSIKIHTGSGTDTPLDLYWNSSRAIWNNGGDTATLKDQNGEIIDEMSG